MNDVFIDLDFYGFGFVNWLGRFIVDVIRLVDLICWKFIIKKEKKIDVEKKEENFKVRSEKRWNVFYGVNFICSFIVVRIKMMKIFYYLYYYYIINLYSCLVDKY